MVTQTQTIGTKKNTKNTSRKGGATKTAGKSAAAKAPTKANGKTTGVVARGGRSPAGSKSQGASGKSSQQQAAPQRQGEGTMSPSAGAPMFGGTRQVLIEEVVMSNRGGRKQGPEPYPFGDLTPSRVQGGAILGPSFFIPDSENPKKIIAAGRKRHKGAGKIFLTRQMEGPSIEDPNTQVSGTRVWLAPANYGK
jgi:hypothetical protein